MATAQYLSATDNPFVAVDVQRRGLSFFGEGRHGPPAGRESAAWTSSIPTKEKDSDSQRRYVFGGAHWSQVGRGRLGVVVTLEQSFQTSNSQLLGRRLLGQTQIKF